MLRRRSAAATYQASPCPCGGGSSMKRRLSGSSTWHSGQMPGFPVTGPGKRDLAAGAQHCQLRGHKRRLSQLCWLCGVRLDFPAAQQAAQLEGGRVAWAQLHSARSGWPNWLPAGWAAAGLSSGPGQIDPACWAWGTWARKWQRDWGQGPSTGCAALESSCIVGTRHPPSVPQGRPGLGEVQAVQGHMPEPGLSPGQACQSAHWVQAGGPIRLPAAQGAVRRQAAPGR